MGKMFYYGGNAVVVEVSPMGETFLAYIQDKVAIEFLGG